MSLTEAVRFRFLTGQLTNAETIKLFTNLAHDQLDLIFSLLFQHLTGKTSPSNNANSKLFQQWNETASAIIRERHSTTKETTTSSKKLNRLPKTLIGEIASFLPQEAYYALMRVDRKCYLGTNTPNKLHALRLTWEIDQDFWPSFPFVKYFRCDLDAFIVCNIPATDSFLPSLQTLRIDGQDGEEDADYNSSHIKKFLKHNPIQTTNIDSVYISHFSCINTAVFDSLLSEFDHVQYLAVGQTYVDANGLDFTDRFPNLKGLAIYTNPDNPCTIYSKLLQAKGHQLEHLVFSHMHFAAVPNLSDINFGHLEELQLIVAEANEMHSIFKSAVNLRKIGLYECSEEGMILKILQSCKSLRFLHVVTTSCGKDDDFDFEFVTPFIRISDEIESGLFSTRDWRRERLTIKVGATYSEMTRLSDVYLRIQRILNSLRAPNIGHFTFIIENRYDGEDEELEDELSARFMQQIHGLAKEIVVRKHRNMVIISNEERDLSEYLESFERFDFMDNIDGFWERCMCLDFN